MLMQTNVVGRQRAAPGNGLFCVVLAVVIVGSCSCLASAQQPPESRRLIVATKISPPFAFKRADDSWSGISIEVWRSIAEEIGVEYEIREMELQEMIDRVASGDVDVAAAAISITADRDKRIDFTHVYFTTGLGVAVPKNQSSNFWNIVRGLLTNRFFEILGGLVVLACIAGYLFWRLERRRNEGMFGGRTREGMGMGLWWSTIMLLGHKGVVPATGWGRVLAGSVMIVSTIAVSALTGVLASVITVSQLSTTIAEPEDLRNVRTATVASSTSAEYLRSRRIRHRTYANIDQALRALAKGDSDAVVYDLALLQHHRNTDPSLPIEVLPQTFTVQHYAIALQSESELREPVNQALLKFTSSDEWSDVLYRFLGE